MANKQRWIGNIYGAQAPLIMKGLFQAGATEAVEVGDMLEFTADTNARFTRVDSDYNMATNGDLAIANEEIKSGDRAGYYQVIVPRDGDIFEYDLDTASALVHGTALYWSADETLTATTGTAIIGYSVGQGHYPLFQGHLSEDNGPDRGETVRSTSVVHVMFRWTNSYLYRFQKS